MNAPAPKPVAAEPVRSLADALAECLDGPEPFAEALAPLAAALTTARAAHVFEAGGERPRLLACTRPSRSEEAAALAAQVLASGEPQAVAEGLLASRMALEGGPGALVLTLPEGRVARALAMERATLLAAVAAARHDHPGLAALRRAVAAAGSVGRGEDAERALADALAALTGAAVAAVGRRASGSIAIAGQAEGARRAALPDRLRREMKEGLPGPGRHLARGPAGGWVLWAEGVARAGELVPLVAAALEREAAGAAPAGLDRRRVARHLVAAAGLAALALAPIPDGVDVPATVAAAERRVVTAPFTAALAEVLVGGGREAVAEGAPVARLDTGEVELDLIAARAERAEAVLRREAARSGLDAAALRGAELEADRLRARIDALEARRERGTLRAPIAGTAVAMGLGERRGAVVRQGETLLEIEGPGPMELELAVPQSRMGRLAEGASGRFRPDFDPALSVEARVTLLSPAAAEAERAPVFRGEAALLGGVEGLRPGVSGVLQLERERRPLGAIAWDRLRGWVLLNLWP